MVFAATLLIAAGLVTGLLGLKLFRLLLPLVGLVSGFMVGFVGVQSVFGTGSLSNAMAVLVALVVGVVLAVLSFMFYEFAVAFLVALLGASALAYLGVALGLNENGFLVFLLSLSGFIIGFVVSQSYPVSRQLVVAVTSLLGVAYVLVGFMLVAGTVSLDDLNRVGIVRTLLDVVDQSLVWFMVWLGGSLIVMQLQERLAAASMFTDAYTYPENRSKR